MGRRVSPATTFAPRITDVSRAQIRRKKKDEARVNAVAPPTLKCLSHGTHLGDSWIPERFTVSQQRRHYRKKRFLAEFRDHVQEQVVFKEKEGAFNDSAVFERQASHYLQESGGGRLRPVRRVDMNINEIERRASSSSAQAYLIGDDPRNKDFVCHSQTTDDSFE